MWIRLDKTQSAHSEFGLPPSSDLSRLSGEPLLDIRHKKARLYVEALLLVVGPLSSRRMTMSFNRTALAVTLAETQSGIAGAFRYKSGSFEPNTPRNWIAGYQTILARAAAEPGLSLGRLAELAGL